MVGLNIEKGAYVFFSEEQFEITEILNLTFVLCTRVCDGKRMRLPIKDLSAKKSDIAGKSDSLLELASEADWEVAKKRFEIINSISISTDRKRAIDDASRTNKIHQATIYRWIKKFEDSGQISSLLPAKRLGGKGKSRLTRNKEELVKEIIESHYLTSQKLSVARLYVEIQLACRAKGISPPHINTIRNRIIARGEHELIKRRHGRKAADQALKPLFGRYDKATFPLSIVQIDHTLLDIVLVDEENRRPIGRPWLTVAIDVYSRIITGYYISFDPPSSMSVGLCLSHSILTKEDYLISNDIETEWPCWGLMKTVHADNAKEFRGKMLQRACEEYGIDLQWRPVTKPHWGGHIERLIGSINTELHSLPGTTFSNKKDRENYNSEAQARLTIRELENYLTVFITGVYHQRIHSSLGTSPIYRYKEGILGSTNFSGYGLPAKIENSDKLKRDFMPFFERSVQRYGVKIEKITYYHDVLRRWVNAKVEGSKSEKRKFIFRRDPRDISQVYFLDPEDNRYYPIPYLDISKPSISIWEYRESVKKLKEEGVQAVDEDQIFESYKRLNEIKNISNNKTLTKKRNRFSSKKKDIHKDGDLGLSQAGSTVEIEDIIPFDDIDHGTY